MGILSTILGSGDVIGKGLELIDSMHTSDEEMIAPFKVAQRYLALMFGFTFVGSYLMVLMLFFMNRDISAVQEIISAFKIDWITLSIVGFYFGGGAFEGVLSKKRGK